MKFNNSKNSLCFSLFHKSKQIGPVRTVTDYATFVYLCDVIIDEQYRKQGLGKWLLESVLSHPHLKDIKRWRLITKDTQEFYKQAGFRRILNPERYMEIIK